MADMRHAAPAVSADLIDSLDALIQLAETGDIGAHLSLCNIYGTRTDMDRFCTCDLEGELRRIREWFAANGIRIVGTYPPPAVVG